MKRNIPNMLTLMNLAAGFFSIIFLFNDQILYAAWMIVVAMVLDFCDGFAARMLKAYSELGRQLDSLADAVSFGVVPGLIIYYMIDVTGSEEIWPFLIFPVLIPLAAVLRLARFNIDEGQKETFTGLPTPAAALAVISLVFADHYGSFGITDIITGSRPALSVYSVIISFLMISPLKMISLKFSSAGITDNWPKYLLIALSVLILVITGVQGTALIIPLYVLISIIERVVR
jgi:CDP-diacylglycerol---serine O-phosphatidyltransferase